MKREYSASREAEGEKNLKKVLENLLTKLPRCGILFKLSAEKRAHRSLTIEQQEIKVQARLCEENLEFL